MTEQELNDLPEFAVISIKLTGKYTYHLVKYIVEDRAYYHGVTGYGDEAYFTSTKNLLESASEIKVLRK